MHGAAGWRSPPWWRHAPVLELLQPLPVLHDELVRREQHVEAAGRRPLRHLSLPDGLARVGRALVRDGHRVGDPLAALELPVGEHRERHDDHEGARDVLRLHQVGDERDGLDRLAQPHLVGEDAVEVVVVQRDHPAQPLQAEGEEERWEEASGGGGSGRGWE